MAQRLATVYVKACLELTEAEMNSFLRLFAEHGASLQVKVLENGNQEIVFFDGSSEDSVLSFERKFGKWVCQGSFRLTNPQAANAMRKAVSMFKGNAVVHRLYTGFTMVYQYEQGSVIRIAELNNGREKVVYAYENRLGKLEEMFRRSNIETEIGDIQAQINGLLDLRNTISDSEIRAQIDSRLHGLSHRLFFLEA